MSKNRVFAVERPENEPVLDYEPGSEEREELKAEIERLRNSEPLEIPLMIGGEEVKTGDFGEIRCPHDHSRVLARYHRAGPEEAEEAIEAALSAREGWADMSWEDRVAIFDRAASLLSGPWRATINAATMLGQSKNPFQAEIDSACELIDFLRFNNYYLSELYSNQPESTPTEINKMEYRPLEGFVFAVSPFNFTSIGGNLPGAPAVCGNVALWKPASTAVYSNYYYFKLLKEAGLPDGVINFIPGSGSQIGPVILGHSALAGVHFTGSTSTFRDIWQNIGKNIEEYNDYPRIVGETGGKDFVVAHESADKDELITALIRGAYEYQGQKCSAISRAYLPRGYWQEMKYELIEKVENLKMGPVEDFTNFINAVIDKAAFDKIVSYIQHARESDQAEIICGGDYDASEGFFIEPTIVLADDPRYKSMCEEIFGPVLTIYLYDEGEYEKALNLCDETSPYGLTGAIFARERDAIIKARDILTYSAGNFYINDKPTGAVVGRQPFGGARASGTNDKAGSRWNIMRWLSPRTIKENLVPPRDYGYPFMQEE